MLTGLKQRGARWYLRRRVPADLVGLWGSAEVNRALGTSDYKIARALLPKAWSDIDDEFAAMRASPAPEQIKTAQVAPVDASVVAARLLPKLRARRDAAAAAGELAAFNLRMSDFQAYEQFVLDGEETPSGPLATHEGVRNAIRALLTGEGALALPAADALPKDERAEGNPTISELHELWLKQQEWPRSTVQGMGRAVARLNQVLGIKQVGAVTRQDVTLFTDKMREPGVVTPKGVSVPNMNTTLSLLSALFGFAVKRNLIEANPARGSQLKDVRRPREKRREFDEAALKAIFGSPIYTSNERPEGGAGEAVYWLPLLALHTGARINELCQLHPDDVAQEGYTDRRGKAHKAWVIRIEHDRAKGKRVKTEGSERRIPVHPDLIKLGFVTYAQGQAGKPLLFDRLTLSAAEDTRGPS